MFDDGIITLGDGKISVDGEMVSGSRRWVRDPRLHNPTARMVEAAFRRAVSEAIWTPLPDGMKWCYICGRIKLLSEFPVEPRNFDGRRGDCNECEAARKRLRRAHEAALKGREVRRYERRRDS